MQVCAHINYGPFTNGHETFPTMGAAVDFFRREVVDNPYLTTEFSEDSEYSDYGVMDLYPHDGCDCSDGMNFHDYPMVRYGVGRRGGLRRVAV
ncbi:hypothetical protein FDH96_gp104 [Mycobacterium phage Rey]|uniref:Uncharacterized protein n=1 Tax=Mycobacterium phage Rey TaxID=1034115 RepID=G1D5L5_9CAUD|nr:hypothetical protein FDH96_gp104 [Mycobacterium phage Rey]AEK10063.1 hypothetical protein PBI_REY_175 [Mycobacterium phage Rey]